MSQQTEFNQNIIEKVKKLLAMANDSRGNENEANLAMERVQQLLASYNLTMSEVENSPDKNNKTIEDTKRAKTTIHKNAMYKYQQLMSYIADSHYCVYFLGERMLYNEKSMKWNKRKYHVLIGREVNTVTATLMFDYLDNTINKLVNELYPNPLNLTKSAVSWREGCARRLCQRLYERRVERDNKQKEEAQKASNGTGLMLLTDIRSNEQDLNNDFYYGYPAGTTTKRRHEYLEAQKNKVEVPEAEVLSDKERADREKKWKKAQEKYQREQSRRWANKDIRAFNAGFEKGNEIGLDDQLQTTNLKQVG